MLTHLKKEEEKKNKREKTEKPSHSCAEGQHNRPVIIWLRAINRNQYASWYSTSDCLGKNYNYYQPFLSDVPRGSTIVAFSLFVTAWSVHAQSGGVRKQGQISPSADDSRREGTSWSDETHSQQETFIHYCAITETLYPPVRSQHYPRVAGNHSDSFSSSFPFFVVHFFCFYVWVCSAANSMVWRWQTWKEGTEVWGHKDFEYRECLECVVIHPRKSNWLCAGAWQIGIPLIFFVW